MKSVKLTKATAVVARIIEVFHWVGVITMLVCLILSLVMADKMEEGFNKANDLAAADSGITVYETVEIYDFNLDVFAENGRLSLPAMRIVFVGGIFVLSLWAMVFRNVQLIAKSTMNPQLSWFNPDNIRMVREIGIFAIASPIVSLIISIIGRIILGGSAEISISVSGFVIGLLVLFLTQFFIRGAELENEVEGLV